MKDYYAILNLDRRATAEEIKAAYRALAKTLHPDVNPAGAGVFREVQEAYDTLSDAAKRRAYDVQSKVHQFVPPASSAARESFQPGGAVDLLKLAGAFISPDLQGHVMPTLKRILEDRGITPEAATVEQVLQATGVLKRKRRAKRA